MMKNQNFKVYCLTLKTTPERTDSAKQLFNNLNLDVEFFYADRHPLGSKYGCWDSHLQIWQSALSKGADYIMVFEDDVSIEESNEILQKVYDDAVESFKIDKDLIYVNLYNVCCHIDNVYGCVYIGPAPTNCAYIMNVKRLFERKNIEDLKPSGLHLDFELQLNSKSKALVKTACIYPKLKISQGKFGTTNDYGKIGNFILKNIFEYDKAVLLTKLCANFLTSLPLSVKRKVSFKATELMTSIFQDRG